MTKHLLRAHSIVTQKVRSTAHETPGMIRGSQNHGSRAAGVFGVGFLLEGIDFAFGTGLRRTVPVEFPFLYEGLQLLAMTAMSKVDLADWLRQG